MKQATRAQSATALSPQRRPSQLLMRFVFIKAGIGGLARIAQVDLPRTSTV